MTYMHAEFQDRIAARFGLPANRPQPGESFDAANDCFLSDCGKFVVFRHDGFSTRCGIDVRGRLRAAMMEALNVWEVHKNGREAWDRENANDPTELGFG